MQTRRSLSLRLFLIAGLLLQVAGSPPLNGTGSQKSAAGGGQAEVLGFFAASEAAAGLHANAAAEPPPPLPDAGPYRQTTNIDPITNQVNTNVGGTILTDTTWTLAGSPYIATSSVTVAPTATLTIEPGVVISYETGMTMLVEGRLLAQGTSEAGITFAGVSAQPGAWSGLTFEGTLADPLTGSELAYVTVSDGGRFSTRPGNIYLFHATVNVDYATITNGLYSGVYAGEGGLAHVTNSTVANNGQTSVQEDYAIWITRGEFSPNLANLTLTGNSQDAVALGGGTLNTRTWRFIGYPYILTGIQTVPYTATLTIEPGVVVKAGGNAQTIINVAGRLEALGEPTAPITFTAMTAAPGAWGGLAFAGQIAKLATGVLRYTTVEYGGSCSACANVSATFAQINISHGQFRFSSKSGVRAAANSAAGLIIENSQFVGNTAYGVDNADPNASVLAANNWWGHASGPTTSPPNNCNVGGQGQAITGGVAFLPFLTDPDAPADEVAPAGSMSLSLNPLRYYAPADGTTRVWFEVTLRDGAGYPIIGQVVRLRTNLGTPVDGGMTDASGKSFAYLTSNTVGEADVFAELDTLTACEFVRSATTDISFSAPANDPLSPDAQSPYSNAGVEFDPKPVILGVPGTLRVRLHNPNPFSITVDATFSFAQLGLGLIFGPVGQVNDFIIQPESDGVLELPWVPLITGHFCIRVDYNWEPAVTVTGLNLVNAPGSTQSNTGAGAGPMLRPFDKNAIRRASIATTSLGDISFAAAGLDDIAATGAPAASAPVGFLQGLMVSNILDFIFEGGGGIDCAMDGGTSCGGWQGPRLHVPGESMGNLAGDPPSPDYETLVPLEILTFPPAVPDANTPPARAAAVNDLVRAGLDLTSYLTAAAVSYDRYAGAVEANEPNWATLHANAFTHYLKEAALRMDDVADKMDALVAQLHAEDLKFLLAEQDFIDYQTRLLNEGFNDQELEAARMVGKTDEGIALSLQRRLALDPAEVSGWFDVRMTEAAQAFRELSLALTFVPVFGSVGGVGAQSIMDEEDDTLVRIGQPEFSFQVSNPFSATTTIDLRVRRLDLPPDWLVTLSTESVTLAPGQQVTVTATASPGLPGVQGTLPRFAVEGHANGALLGGVEFQVYLPMEHPFFGSDRVFLPVMRQP